MYNQLFILGVFVGIPFCMLIEMCTILVSTDRELGKQLFTDLN